MSNFSFYCGPDKAAAQAMRRAAASLWGEIEEVSAGSFCLFIPSVERSVSLGESPDALGAVSGYVRSDEAARSPEEDKGPDRYHNQRFIAEIINDDNWPLGKQWTGSFAACAYSKREDKLVICNDPIGYIPLYYSSSGQGMLGGTSLILLSHCIKSEADPIGVLQRIMPPYFSNYGKRTPLKDVWRPMPGERLKCSGKESNLASSFDNTLYQGLVNPDPDTAARMVWDCLEREIALAAGDADKVSIAIGGGLDSRLTLGGIAGRGKAIKFYTYGSSDKYEPSIAGRCAKATGAECGAFSLENNYFPGRSEFESLVKKTESVQLLQWNSILSTIADKETDISQLLLFGDIMESIDGKKIISLFTREVRMRNFLKESLLGREASFHAADAASFEEWKKALKGDIIKAALREADNLSSNLRERCSNDFLIKEMENDLELTFTRVKENLPSFSECFDELFLWYTRKRFHECTQLLLMGSKFRAISPGTSMRFMRLISTIHPGLRLKDLRTKIIRLPEFKNLGRIPTTQIPWVGAVWPAPLRMFIWFIRVSLDQFLIRRCLKNKNPQGRQRVLKSLDYMKEYRRQDTLSNVQSWFSEKWIKSDLCITKVKNRASLATLPYINDDIVTPANVSIMLDLCKLD